MNCSTVSFFSDLGRRISSVSGDIREYYLFQCIAVTIQRFNSMLFFRDSFLSSDDFDF